MSSSDACICNLEPSQKPMRIHSSKRHAHDLSTGTYLDTAFSENAFESCLRIWIYVLVYTYKHTHISGLLPCPLFIKFLAELLYFQKIKVVL
jgi:hypothetical protein